MYEIQLRLGLRPRPRWESLQRSPRPPIAGLRGLLLRGGEGTGRVGDGERKGRDGKGIEGQWREGEGTRAHPSFTPLIHIS